MNTLCYKSDEVEAHFGHVWVFVDENTLLVLGIPTHLIKHWCYECGKHWYQWV